MGRDWLARQLLVVVSPPSPCASSSNLTFSSSCRRLLVKEPRIRIILRSENPHHIYNLEETKKCILTEEVKNSLRIKNSWLFHSAAHVSGGIDFLESIPGLLKSTI
jgi:hypothetical protein